MMPVKTEPGILLVATSIAVSELDTIHVSNPQRNKNSQRILKNIAIVTENKTALFLKDNLKLKGMAIQQAMARIEEKIGI